MYINFPVVKFEFAVRFYNNSILMFSEKKTLPTCYSSCVVPVEMPHVG